MKVLRKSGLIAVMIMIMAAVTALPAFANGGGSTLVAEATWTTHTIDSSAGGGFWANLELHSYARIYEIGDGEYKLVVTQTGTFNSWAGVSPNGTGTIADNVTGTVNGGFIGYISGDLKDDLGDEGTFDYGCEKTPASCEDYVSFTDILFDSHGSFTYEAWEWTYSTCDGRTAIQSSIKGYVGDITGEPAVCETDAPEPLVEMYVFYSESGFYEHNGGTVNTMTLMSSEGVPHKGAVARWTGVAPDALPEYNMVCSDTLYDDGTDRGRFACDSFLSSVGERRASLRNDIQGPEFDLLPKVERYLSQVEELRELGLLK